MKVEMLMPQMGESITEATVSKWLKKVGDTVKKDEIILEISTDKVDSEIPAPDSGVLVEILAPEGQLVPVKTAIAFIDTNGAGAAKVAPPSAEVSSPASNTGATNGSGASAQSAVSDTESSKFFSPVVKSLAEKHGVSQTELSSVKGSGQGGRVTKEDLLKYLDTRQAPSSQAATPKAETPRIEVSTPQGAPTERPIQSKKEFPADIGGWNEDGTKIIPMDNMRQAIADHMVRSKHTSPHVYSMQEVDCTNISKWRAKNKDAFKAQEGFNLSFTPFFLEASVKALQKFPWVNASVGEKKIILKRNINLGCAVALENAGLIVPVIKRAEEKNFIGLARSLNDVALRARSKKLLPDDVAGGTFTVTNPGIFGTMIGTPIINQPQVAILCLGAIEKRPVVVDDMIAIRERCYLTLSYDHRIVDGMLGGQFLAAVKDHLENWDINRPLN